jgi:hypothetical protein
VNSLRFGFKPRCSSGRLQAAAILADAALAEAVLPASSGGHRRRRPFPVGRTNPRYAFDSVPCRTARPHGSVPAIRRLSEYPGPFRRPNPLKSPVRSIRFGGGTAAGWGESNAVCRIATTNRRGQGNDCFANPVERYRRRFTGLNRKGGSKMRDRSGRLAFRTFAGDLFRELPGNRMIARPRPHPFHISGGGASEVRFARRLRLPVGSLLRRIRVASPNRLSST